MTDNCSSTEADEHLLNKFVEPYVTVKPTREYGVEGEVLGEDDDSDGTLGQSFSRHLMCGLLVLWWYKSV